MVVILRENYNEEQRDNLVNWLESLGITVHSSLGEHNTVLGLVGDTSGIDIDLIKALDIVEDVKRIQEPYKNANRKFHPEDTVVVIDEEKDIKIGGGNFQIIAGPCSVESEEQVCGIAQAVQKSGATLLRGGAFKPRTSPYSFQGLRAEGLELLQEARAVTGQPIVTELMSPYDIDTFVDKVDCIQVGARNMQNFDLLKQLGKIRKPILLKRGLSATIEEWLMSAEYIMAGGNEQVILCERGIRTFETYTRNTLDLSAICAVKKLSHLPVIVDPSHSTGKSWMVQPIARAAIAVGADGVMIEVHNDPAHALCDGAQSITPAAFVDVMADIRKIAEAVGREV